MNRRLDSLCSEARWRAQRLLEACRKVGMPLVITSALRTHAEQHQLWRQGRELLGPIVTRADSGQSWHETGRAFDVAFLVTAPGPAGRLTWDGPWEKVAAIAKPLGLEWGGNWATFSGDRDHFQFTGGLTLAQAIAEQDARAAA